MLEKLGDAMKDVATHWKMSRLWRARESSDRRNRAHVALDVCGQLLKLVECLQQHRGMSSAWLEGDRTFEPQMVAKRNEVVAVLKGLEAHAWHEAKQVQPAFTPATLETLRTRWHRLTNGLNELSLEMSLAYHGQMIALVLGWLAAYGAMRIGLPHSAKMPPGLVLQYCRKLPLLAETLGQARAIGMGVAARGGCTPMARVRLMFLTTQAESLLQESADFAKAGGSGEKAFRNVADMLKIVRREMLADNGIAIVAPDYFSLSTLVIGSVFDWIAECGAELTTALDADARIATAAVAAKS